MIIDPTQLKQDEPYLLALLLKQYIFLDEEIVYQVKRPDTQEMVSIQLNHPIIQRARKEDEKGVRFEILGEVLGTGGAATVYASLGTLCYGTDDTVLFKKKRPGEERVVKVQSHAEIPVANVHNEYALGKMAGHLDVKKPTFVRITVQGNSIDYSYSTLRRLPGMDLHAFLNKNRSLSVHDRFMLIYKILDALKTQVHEKDLLHLDLNPNNIFIDPDDFTIHIFDFGLSLNKNNPATRENLSDKGTVGYMSPESWGDSGVTYFEKLQKPFDRKLTEKSDIFSVGMICAQILGTRQFWSHVDTEEIAFIFEKEKFKNMFFSIKKKPLELSKETQQKIILLLEDMTRLDASERISITAAKTRFYDIQLQEDIKDDSLKKCYECGKKAQSRIKELGKNDDHAYRDIIQKALVEIEDKKEYVQNFARGLGYLKPECFQHKAALLSFLEGDAIAKVLHGHFLKREWEQFTSVIENALKNISDNKESLQQFTHGMNKPSMMQIVCKDVLLAHLQGKRLINGIKQLKTEYKENTLSEKEYWQKCHDSIEKAMEFIMDNKSCVQEFMRATTLPIIEKVPTCQTKEAVLSFLQEKASPENIIYRGYGN